MYIERHIRKILETNLKEYPVTLITGARQVGKTTLVTEIEKDLHYTYLSFDDTDHLGEAKADPKSFLRNHPAPIILDEIQRVPELFIEIEAMVNEVRRKEGNDKANGMFILTGSQKYHLMKGIAESLSGRVGIIEMPPLSQAEIRGWEDRAFEINAEKMMALSEERVLTDEDLYDSIVRGFYPARWETKGVPIHNFYFNYTKTYLERDVSQLIHLREQTKFENLLKLLASLTGEEFVPDNIAKSIGTSKNTIMDWISILVAGDIITLLPSYYEDSINKRIVKRKKLFFNDTGLACHLLGIRSSKSLMLSVFKGRMIETYIHNEIRKSLLNNGIPSDGAMFFYRDSNQNEIDLILFINGELQLIECKAGKRYTQDAIKGFSQLVSSSYNIFGKCVLCTTEEPYRIQSGVFALPIRCI
ncbi:MAG: ATP-binding protein [Candidatus Enteromonas sp.]